MFRLFGDSPSSLSSIKRVALTSMLLMQQFRGASAYRDVYQACADQGLVVNGHYITTNTHVLYILPPHSFYDVFDDETLDALVEMGTPFRGCEGDEIFLDWSKTKEYKIAGGWFKTPVCKIYSEDVCEDYYDLCETSQTSKNHANPIPILQQRCAALTGPIYTDYVILSSLLLGGIGIPCAAILLNRYLRRQGNQQAPAAIEQGVESESVRISNEDRWDELDERIEALVSANVVGAKTLSTDFQTVCEEYRCPIMSSMMSEPVSLPCRHNFEKAGLLNHLHAEQGRHHAAKCPCCRGKLETADVKTNELMREAIDYKYRYFVKETTQLESLRDQPVHSLRSSLGSSSRFYSAKSSPNNSDSDDEVLTLAGALPLRV